MMSPGFRGPDALDRFSAIHTRAISNHDLGVVGCGKCVVYLTSLGRSTDIGLQLGKVLAAGKGRGENTCISSVSLLSSLSLLFSLSLSFIFSTISSISFLPISRRRHKTTHKG